MSQGTQDDQHERQRAGPGSPGLVGRSRRGRQRTRVRRLLKSCAYAARKLSDRLHLLRLPQLLFKTASLPSHIAGAHDEIACARCRLRDRRCDHHADRIALPCESSRIERRLGAPACCDRCESQRLRTCCDQRSRRRSSIASAESTAVSVIQGGARVAIAPDATQVWRRDRPAFADGRRLNSSLSAGSDRYG